MRRNYFYNKENFSVFFGLYIFDGTPCQLYSSAQEKNVVFLVSKAQYVINTYDLHQLIKRLTKSEKRYFKDKTFKLNPSGTKYLELFNLLDGIEEYTDEIFKKELKNIKLIKNVSYTQNYLFHTILEELHNYRKQNDIELKIKDTIAQAKFLYERNLLTVYKKVLINALKQAKKYEYFGLQLEILKNLKGLIKVVVNKKGLSKQINQLNSNIKTVKHQQELYSKLQHLLNKIYDLGHQGFDLRNDTKATEFNQIVEQVNQLNIISDYGFRILFYYNVLKETIGGKLQTDTSVYGKNILNLYNSYSHFKEIDLTGYIKSTLNYLQTLIELKHFEEAKRCFDELNKQHKYCINKGLLFLASLVEEGILVSKFYLTYEQGLKEETEKNITTLNNYLNRDEISEYKKVWYMNAIPVFYFDIRNYDKALEWVNYLLNIPVSKGMNVDHYSKLKVIEIISQFELGNYLVLDALIRTVEKYLRKYERYYETEKILFKLFRNKQFRYGNTDELKTTFTKTHNSLKELKDKNPFEKKQLEQINYLAWLETKVAT